MPIARNRLMPRLRAMQPARVSANTGHLAMAGLLVLLFALPGFALWAASTAYHATMVARQATRISTTLDAARYAASAEESLERKYQLSPGPAVRVEHGLASDNMVTALQIAAEAASSTERHNIRNLLERHSEYLDAIERMFAAIDRSETAEIARIDAQEVDPLFEAIQTEVERLANRHRAMASEQLQSLADVQTRVLIATPVVFLSGAGLVLLLWRVLRRYQARTKDLIVREADRARNSEQRYRGLVQNTSDLILICTSLGRISYCSPGAQRVWAHTPARLTGHDMTSLTHAEDRNALLALWQAIEASQADAPAQTAELRLKDGSGTWREAELTATNRLDDPAIAGIVVTIRDITERKDFERRLGQQAFFDELTGLPNRVLFRDRLEHALLRATRHDTMVGLLFLDLDNFKLVNDSLGHHAGDELLRQAAARLRDAVRAQDTVARLGGDEFVVLIEQLATPADAAAVASVIEEQFGRPFAIDGHQAIVTASLGIVVGGGNGQDANALLRDADVAMYRAKSAGRDRHVVFEPGMRADSLARLALAAELRHAIEHDELRVHYQPIVAIDTGHVIKLEALVRWQHPHRGLIDPGAFIPIAEETGLIFQLDRWVLRTACHQVAVWNAARSLHAPLLLSANLSPRHVQQPNLLDDLHHALHDSGLPPECLQLEITEGMIIRNTEATIETLRAIRGMGIQLAVDDFGTGYSSLSYLKRLPLGVLKIDRSFISGIETSQEDVAIVRAILAMAQSLGLEVTAEGIETQAQARLLRSWGCGQAQGYLFSRPLDKQAATQFLLATNPRQLPRALHAEAAD